MRINELLFTVSQVLTLVSAGRLQVGIRSSADISNSTTGNTSTPSTQASKACASVSAIYSTQSKNANDNLEVPAQLAFDCLQSVPLDEENATRWVKSLRTILQFQSTIAFNKNPPISYQMPTIDIANALDEIEEKVRSGLYNGEYEFETALYGIVLAIHDDHLDYKPDLIGNTFEFTRKIGLASISQDGMSLPKLFVIEDLPSAPAVSQNSSAVVSIDSQPAVSFLQTLSQNQSGQDPDTNYNRALVNLATFSAGNDTGAFAKSVLFPGANTTVQFESGNTKVYENKAVVRADFSTIKDPQSLYAQVCSRKQLNGEPKEQAANNTDR